jgi:hypothetical protein
MTWRLADTEVTLDTEGPRKGEVYAMRQISLFESTRTRQPPPTTIRTARCPTRPKNPPTAGRKRQAGITFRRNHP